MQVMRAGRGLSQMLESVAVGIAIGDVLVVGTCVMLRNCPMD